MFDQMFQWLVEHEPAISAFVGLLTLIAGAWGVLNLLLYQRTSAIHAPPGQTESDRLIAPPGKSSLLSTLLNLGLTERSELEDLVSIRTVNIALLALLLISLVWIIASLFSRETLSLTVTHGAIFIALLGVYVMQATGRTSLARWTFFCLSAIYWIVIMVAVGPLRSVEYFFAIMIMLPVLLFSKRESRHQLAAIVVMVTSFAVAVFLQTKIPSMAILDELPVLNSVAYYINLALLCVAIFLTVNFYNNVAAKSFHDLESQKLRTEELVKSILPEYVASRIKDQQYVIADWHREATVLIATVVGFETLSKRISAVQLVEILSEIFVRFDKLVKQFGVEKVNTLDTTYVVAIGIGEEREPDHCNVAAFALAALEVVKQASATFGHPFYFRAGISTGQVVSGVIGEARPCFDIWGDTVELANSMRDTAVDNSIVVNEPAYWRLIKRFDFAAVEDASGNHLLLREKSDGGDGSGTNVSVPMTTADSSGNR